MKILVILLLFASISVNAKGLTEFFSTSNDFLNLWVKNGKVDYKGVKKNFSTIEGLYQQIGDIDITNASTQERKAFYINAYNLCVIYQVAKYYPLKSPMNFSGFFDKINHKVAGESMSLNTLEIKKLLLPYGDARIHFALACAAISCPSLANFAYTPGQLDQQLELRAAIAINDPEFIKVNVASKKIEVSKIFKWYEKDFTKDGQSLLTFINQYRKNNIPGNYQIDFYEYDWRLNEK